MNFHLYSFVVAALLWSIGIYPKVVSAQTLDLVDVYRLAEINDAQINAARYSFEGARQQEPIARAALLPAINASANKGAIRAETAFTDVPPVDRAQSSWAWTIQLTQPIIRPTAVYAYQQSKYAVEQAEAQYDQAQQDLLLRSAQSYFGVCAALEVIEASTIEMNALKEQLDQVTHGFKAGTHSLIDVDDTNSRLESARARQVAAQNDLEQKRAELESTIGKTFVQIAILNPRANIPEPQPKNSHVWIGQARVNHPSVRAQRASLAVAKGEIKRSRAEYSPTLDFVASTGNTYSSTSLTTPNEFGTRASSTQIAVQLNIPIYSGGATNARVSQAIANKNKAEAELESASRKSALDAQQAYAGLVNGLAQINALAAAADAGKRAVKGNRAGYRVGLRINLDVLNAEQQLYAARRDLVAARYGTLLEGLKLKAAVGTLSIDDLIRVNDLLIH